ncbi:MAG: VTC domain-containing protein [Aeromicrobium sp.]
MTEARTTLDFGRFAPASLDDIIERAALMRRVDRKYLVPTATAQALIRELGGSHAVLQIAGRLSTTYRSTYFDTAAFAATRSHVQRRRRRWKIRTRLYVEDDLCRVEVKTKNGRGETVKVAMASTVDHYGQLVGEDLAFVSSAVAPRHPDFRVDSLQASTEVAYTRATLVDLEASCRVTLDWGMAAYLGDQAVRLDDDFVLVETKGGVSRARADRVLTALGARPRAFSKYAATTSLMRDDIHDNDIRSLCGLALHPETRPTEALL